MNKKILITFICSSLILITPLTAVAKENKINNILTTESDIKGLIAQKHVLVNEILEKHGKILKETNNLHMILE